MNLNNILNFLNLLDSNGRLSITNIAVLIVLTKIAIAPTASLTEMGALFVTLINYHMKRKTIADAQVTPEIEDAITPQIEQMKSKLDDALSQVSSLSLKAGIKRME